MRRREHLPGRLGRSLLKIHDLERKVKILAAELEKVEQQFGEIHRRHVAREVTSAPPEMPKD
jgi:hypothetical protein